MTMTYDLMHKGGAIMWPLLGLSVATFTCAFERGYFWWQLMTQEDKIVHDVLNAAQVDLNEAAAIAYQSRNLAIGRFLLAPLQLNRPASETFHLAMEAAADREFIQMRKGDKLLETVIAIAPLLGLLGTVTGLMATFGNLNIGGSGGGPKAAGLTKAAEGIGEALTATASGMLVAIVALVFFRIFVSLQSQQMDYFSVVGSQLELIYRHVWCEGNHQSTSILSKDLELPISSKDFRLTRKS